MQIKEKTSCIIIDDQIFARKIIESHLHHFPEISIAYSGADVREALRMVEASVVDLVFLDIQMPSMNGLTFLKRCRNTCKFIFTTAYPEYAIEGYEHDIIDFLLKPIPLDRFKKSINKYHQLAGIQLSANEKCQVDDIRIKGDAKQKYYIVKLNDIYYVRGLDNYIRILTATGSIITYMNLKDLIQLLPSPKFCRIHRSYIVSLQHISYVEKSAVHILEEIIPIGSVYRKQFFQQWTGLNKQISTGKEMDL